MVLISENTTENDADAEQTLVPLATERLEGFYLERGQHNFITRIRRMDGVILFETVLWSLTRSGSCLI
jgi:hypothetical protein